MTGPIVIKLGGLSVEDPKRSRALLSAIAALHRSDDGGVVIVHGGGKAITRQLEAHGLESEIVDGIRVTPETHIAQVTGVLAGQINKAIAAQLQALGQPAAGLSIGDGGLTVAEPLRTGGVDFGYVGEVKTGDPSLVQGLLRDGFLPVLSPIGRASDGSLLNVNADSAAGAIARIVGARLLILLTDVAGILDESQSLIESIDEPGIESLIDRGVIHGGMIPKVRAALDAARTAKSSTVIASWDDPDALAQIASGAGRGTRLITTRAQGVHP